MQREREGDKSTLPTFVIYLSAAYCESIVMFVCLKFSVLFLVASIHSIAGSLRFCDTYYDTELYPLRIHLLAVKDRAEPWNYPSDGLKIKNGS